MKLRDDAKIIIEETIKSVLPDRAVKNALDNIDFSADRIILVSIGKAAWTMAKASHDILGDKITRGIVITKYGHIESDLAGIEMYEAGHPISDDNSYKATERALEMVSDLAENDLVLFLVSGGGSALFESPLIDKEKLEKLNKDLLASGANIQEINTIRKRLSSVKAGKFAKVCSPARIEAIVLSDVIGDPLDVIASGPAYPDLSTSQDALNIIEKYSIVIDKEIEDLLKKEGPKTIDNARHQITGSVRELVENAEQTARKLGYETLILTDELSCIAKEAGSFLGSMGKYYKDRGPLAIIAGGETTVELTGGGKGGRNQEIALAAADKISGLDNVVVFSVGSDGTDGPTDAAGGLVDGSSKEKIEKDSYRIYQILKDNDSYNHLKKIDGLIMTGPTGTNVNDFTVVLIK